MQPTCFEFTGEDGITLKADAYGDRNNPPVILSHGGGQTRHSWGGTASELASRGWYAVAYDHRGHGESEWSEEGLYDLAHFSLDMACLARSFDEPPVIVGASLGGIAAMLGAGEIHQEMFKAIVLVDVTPSLNLDGVQRIFDFMNEHIERGFGSLEEAADAVALYTGRPRRDDASGMRKNLREKDGRFYWHWDPKFFAQSEDSPEKPTRVIAAARAITLPVLLIRGRASDVVTEAEVQEFLELIPHASYVDVEKARHMVAGDRNDIFTEAVLGFLETL
ncbi:alpha/beta fold hydrolase [Pseudohalioglobus lutimaris]|uniref:Alpha/beta hydrolase n=1 Tax=Pseudohalioglobus lutimaris TaxID=1737061 RepID=A0A2N5X4E5_9GAMM|nr:alpha/beta hydrolase [Pseudohalioglobus lutimaris]PLW69364.1 alpha/beta hydrolase [Pseudohalioglobus lutimaris]